MLVSITAIILFLIIYSAIILAVLYIAFYSGENDDYLENFYDDEWNG